MTTPLHILIAEDSLDDAELMVAQLRLGGFDPRWKRVQTEPDFLAGLKESPDLVLSDYSMPQFSGLRAARLAQESGLNIPFILVSGTVGEEVAVEAMRCGATDYLLKDRIARLGNAVERALEQKRLRAEAIVRHLDGAFARIWALNEREQMLELQASAGLYTHLNGPHGRVPVGKLKIGLIAEERKPHLTNQVVGDPRVGDQEWAKREGMVAFAGYPLLVENRVVGVVAMFAVTRFLKDSFTALAEVLDAHAELLAAAKAGAITNELIVRCEAILEASDLPYLRQQIPQCLDETLAGVGRVAKIVRAMKDFSHPGGKEKTLADLNKAIESTVTAARSEWKYVADLKLELDPALPLAPCFLGEFNQAVLNLIGKGQPQREKSGRSRIVPIGKTAGTTKYTKHTKHTKTEIPFVYFVV